MSRTYFLTICVIIFQHTGRISIRYYALYIYITIRKTCLMTYVFYLKYLMFYWIRMSLNLRFAVSFIDLYIYMHIYIYILNNTINHGLMNSS